jgi:hypothetical protein
LGLFFKPVLFSLLISELVELVTLCREDVDFEALA